MKTTDITKLMQSFDAIANTVPESDVEFWYARELMDVLGYDRWENFSKAIERAAQACQGAGVAAENHFRGVSKMVQLGSAVGNGVCISRVHSNNMW